MNNDNDNGGKDMTTRIKWPDSVEVGKLGPGEYMVNGRRIWRANSGDHRGNWFADDPNIPGPFNRLFDVIEWIADDDA